LCNRHVLISRRHLEERLVLFVERGDPAVSAAVSGTVSTMAGAIAPPPRPDDRAPSE
jgi:hypothetical protein